METGPYILYHANCDDGFGAAFASWMKWGGRADYLAVEYNAPPPEMDPSRPVYIFDFSYPRATVEALHVLHPHLEIWDHHQTAENLLGETSLGGGLPYVHLDMNHSGAVLAWRRWFPEEEPPELLKYVEDRDLWRWVLPQSRAVSLALSSYPRDFHVWYDLAMKSIQQLMEGGSALLDYQQRLIDQIIANSLDIYNPSEPEIEVWRGAVGVNSSILQSEIGERLLERYPEAPFVAVYYYRGEGVMRWSLRSQDHRQNVREVAENYGGGGHRNAAGFDWKD